LELWKAAEEKKNITYMELRESGLVTKTLALLSTATRRHSCPAVRAVLDHLSKNNNKTEKKQNVKAKREENLNECEKKINIGPRHNKVKEKVLNKFNLPLLSRSLEYGKVTALTHSLSAARRPPTT
jgi:hypothetical protein